MTTETDRHLLEEFAASEVWRKTMRRRLAQLREQALTALICSDAKTGDAAFALLAAKRAEVQLLQRMEQDVVAFWLPEGEG